MMPVLALRQVYDPNNRFDRQGAIQMRERLPGPGRFPFQVIAKIVRIDAYKQQVGYPDAMPGRALGDLFAGRKMQKTVSQVVAGSTIGPLCERRKPVRAPT